jgi:hypothetical protein
MISLPGVNPTVPNYMSINIEHIPFLNMTSGQNSEAETSCNTLEDSVVPHYSNVTSANTGTTPENVHTQSRDL